MRLAIVGSCVVAVLSIPALAVADDVGRDTADTISEYMGFLKSLKEDLVRIKPDKSPADCTAAVAQARKAGVKTLVNYEFDALGGTVAASDSSKYEIGLDRADKLCGEYAPFYAVGKSEDLFTRVKERISLLTPEDAPSPDFVKAVLVMAADCTKAVDALTAGGVPGAFAFTLHGVKYTVADLKPKFCDAAVKAAGQFTKDSAAAKKKTEERYTKVGIAGDKLDLMLQYGGGIYLPGGAASEDMKKYAAASALYVWLTGDPDADDMVVHTVRKYEFKGNKILKNTEKTYRKKKGAKVGAVFN